MTTVTIHERLLAEQVLIIGTAATGLLWLSVVGYLSNWWYGMAFFSGAILKVRVEAVLWLHSFFEGYSE
jgi:hypothetical protein